MTVNNALFLQGSVTAMTVFFPLDTAKSRLQGEIQVLSSLARGYLIAATQQNRDELFYGFCHYELNVFTFRLKLAADIALFLLKDIAKMIICEPGYWTHSKKLKFPMLDCCHCHK